MENTQRIKLKADLMWAYLDKPNDMSGKYQVDLCNLSDAAVDALEGMGIAVRQKEDKGFFITCKSQNPIRAYDRDGDTIEGIAIGNGIVFMLFLLIPVIGVILVLPLSVTAASRETIKLLNAQNHHKTN